MTTAREIYERVAKERDLDRHQREAQQWIEDAGFDRPEFDGVLWRGVAWKANVTNSGIVVEYDIRDDGGVWSHGDHGYNEATFAFDDRKGVQSLFERVCRQAWLHYSERQED
jgi:hypothetical protein